MVPWNPQQPNNSYAAFSRGSSCHTGPYQVIYTTDMVDCWPLVEPCLRRRVWELSPSMVRPYMPDRIGNRPNHNTVSPRSILPRNCCRHCTGSIGADVVRHGVGDLRVISGGPDSRC